MQGVVACWVNIDLLYTDKWNSTYNSLVAHLSPIKTEEHGHAPKILINSLQLLATCWPKRLWAGWLIQLCPAFTLGTSSVLAHAVPFPLLSAMMMSSRVQPGGGKNTLLVPSAPYFLLDLSDHNFYFCCIPYSYSSPLLTARFIVIFKSCIFPVWAIMLWGID